MPILRQLARRIGTLPTPDDGVYITSRKQPGLGGHIRPVRGCNRLRDEGRGGEVAPDTATPPSLPPTAVDPSTAPFGSAVGDLVWHSVSVVSSTDDAWGHDLRACARVSTSAKAEGRPMAGVVFLRTTHVTCATTPQNRYARQTCR